MESEVPKVAQRFLKRERTEYLLESANDGMAHLKVILNLQPKERSPSQIQTLANFTKHIKFFAEVAENEGGDAHLQCVQYMSHQYVKSDEGSQFYIILSGSVAVLSPYRHKDGKRDFKLLTVLRSGDSFGELALISNKPRAASILTRETTSLAVLERQDYSRILGRLQDARLNQKVELLQRHPAFNLCSKPTLQKLSYFFKEHIYKRKQVLFKAGQPATEVFLIKSGDFQLIKDISVDHPHRKSALFRESETTHHQAEITLLSVGEMIGDQELISGNVHQYTCMCSSAQGEVLLIQQDDFLKRVVTEDCEERLHDLNVLKETYRSGRIQMISRLESEKWATRLSPTTKEMDLKENALEDPGNIENARNGLIAEVRKRWHLSSRRNGSLALDKARTALWLTSPQSTQTMSSSRSRLLVSPMRTEIGIKVFKSPRSWIEMVQRRYFKKRKGSEVFFHKLQEKGTPMLIEKAKVFRSSSSLSTAHSLVRKPRPDEVT